MYQYSQVVQTHPLPHKGDGIGYIRCRVPGNIDIHMLPTALTERRCESIGLGDIYLIAMKVDADFRPKNGGA